MTRPWTCGSTTAGPYHACSCWVSITFHLSEVNRNSSTVHIYVVVYLTYKHTIWGATCLESITRGMDVTDPASWRLSTLGYPIHAMARPWVSTIAGPYHAFSCRVSVTFHLSEINRNSSTVRIYVVVYLRNDEADLQAYHLGCNLSGIHYTGNGSHRPSNQLQPQSHYWVHPGNVQV
jgi:hypothetical protein